MAEKQNSVFISYRRTDQAWALLVYQYLTKKKFDVFFDFTSISGGDFEKIIINNIKARAHFLLILTPKALDRCDNPGDWLRREIETAMDHQRNIIPLFFDNFSFTDLSVKEKLTGKLEYLSRYNGLPVSGYYFDASMQKLKKQFLDQPLDTILVTLSTEVSKAVEKEQNAANAELAKNPESLKEFGKPAAGENPVDEALDDDDDDEDIEKELNKRYTDGMAASLIGNWEKAIRQFEAILNKRSNYKRTVEKLTEARRGRTLADLYSQAAEAIRLKDWQKSTDLLEKLSNISPIYKDTKQLLANAKKQKQLWELYEDARALHTAHEWDAVHKVFEQISEIDSQFSDPDGLLVSAQKEAAEQKRQSELSAQYASAVEKMDEGKWYEARDLLYMIREMESNYLDSDQLLKIVEGEIRKKELDDRQSKITTLYQQAHELSESKDWGKALEKIEEIRGLDEQFIDADGIFDLSQKNTQIEKLYQQARKFIKAKEWRNAIDKLEEIRKIDEQFVDVDEISEKARDGEKRAEAERKKKEKEEADRIAAQKAEEERIAAQAAVKRPVVEKPALGQPAGSVKHNRTFLSYSRANKDFAVKLAKELKSSGFDIWLDQLDIPAGARWDQEVEKALRESEIFMLILTPSSIASENVKDEIGYAIDNGKRFLPVLLEKCEVPLRLRRFQYADFTNKSFDDGLKAVTELLQRLNGQTMAQKIEPDQKPVATAKNAGEMLTIHGIEFCKVPKGDFLMGNEKKRVGINYDYHISRFPITNEQYANYVNEKKIEHPVTDWKAKKDHPVVRIMFIKLANDYCEWLTNLIKSEIPNQMIVRLPTEAEWEKAARGTTGLLYPWGNQFDSQKCNSLEGGKGTITAVSSYSPQGDSIYGVADMAGNVWERIQSGNNVEDIYKGGSYSDNADKVMCTSSYIPNAIMRGWNSDKTGFRVVIAPILK